MESITTPTARYIKEISSKAENQARDNITIKMELLMKATGKKVKNQGLDK